MSVADWKAQQETAEQEAKKVAETKAAVEKRKADVAKNAAPGKLRFAKVFLEKGDKKKAAERLREIVADHPDTPEAKEAAELLEGIGED